MPKYNFNLRSASAKGNTPINFVIRWGSRRLVYPTGETINPVHWSNALGQRNYQRAKETKAFPEYPEFNERLDAFMQIAKGTFRNFVTDKERDPEVEELRSALDVANGRVEVKNLDLLGFTAEFIESRKGATHKKTGKLLHPSYHGRNQIALDLLKDFAKKNGHGRRVPFSVVNVVFVEKFAKYLTTTRGLSTNTVGKYMRALREFIGAAVDHNYPVSPAVVKRGGISIPEEKTDKIYLNPDELTALFNLDLAGNPRLDRARDLFIVAAWTGLRFGDLCRVQREHIKGDHIEIRTSKTDELVEIPIHSHVQDLLNKYGGQLPPAISNQKLNEYIKEVAKLVPELRVRIMNGRTIGGVRQDDAREKWELIMCHSARRSFATNFYNDDIPILTIRTITGHRTDAVFLRYVVLNKREHRKKLAKSPLFNLSVLKAV